MGVKKSGKWKGSAFGVLHDEKCIWAKCIPWKSKDYFLNGFSVKTIVLVGIYNQQFKGTILFMVFDFQGIYIPSQYTRSLTWGGYEL